MVRNRRAGSLVRGMHSGEVESSNPWYGPACPQCAEGRRNHRTGRFEFLGFCFLFSYHDEAPCVLVFSSRLALWAGSLVTSCDFFLEPEGGPHLGRMYFSI